MVDYLKSLGYTVWKEKRIYINDITVLDYIKNGMNPKAYKKVKMYYNIEDEAFYYEGTTNSVEKTVLELMADLRKSAKEFEEKTDEIAEEEMDEMAAAEETISKEEENDSMLISIGEYAEKYNVAQATIRQSCIRGRFETAKKIGRNWVIDSDEEFIDNRKKALVNETTLNDYLKSAKSADDEIKRMKINADYWKSQINMNENEIDVAIKLLEGNRNDNSRDFEFRKDYKLKHAMDRSFKHVLCRVCKNEYSKIIDLYEMIVKIETIEEFKYDHEHAVCINELGREGYEYDLIVGYDSDSEFSAVRFTFESIYDEHEFLELNELSKLERELVGTWMENPHKS